MCGLQFELKSSLKSHISTEQTTKFTAGFNVAFHGSGFYCLAGSDFGRKGFGKCSVCAVYLKVRWQMVQCCLLFVALFMLGCVSLTHCGAHNISHNGMLETFFQWTLDGDDDDGGGL